MLELRGLQKRFGGLVAVDDVSLVVPAGSIFGLIGPNGAGKTTVFNLISGVSKPTAGQLLLAGEDVTGLPAHAIARRGVVRTFQNIHLFRGYSVLRNVQTALHMSAGYGVLAACAWSRGVRAEERRLAEEARELLELTGLGRFAGQLAESLPYGHQRRLEIAKALAVRPRLLLLDEPAAGMNTEEAARLSDLVRDVRARYDLTVILIEHHIEVVMGLCDRVAVLDFGRSIAEGTPEEVRADPEVIRAYLGVPETMVDGTWEAGG